MPPVYAGNLRITEPTRFGSPCRDSTEGDLGLGGVQEGLVPDEAAHAVGRFRQPTHVPDDGALELRLLRAGASRVTAVVPREVV